MNPAPPPLSRALLALMAVTCGLLVAALYFSQPLTALIGRDLGLAPQAIGFVVTLTQLGYCAGLVGLTPLGDIVENRRLVTTTMALAAVALLVAALAPSGSAFLAASFVVGLTACAVQMLVPLAAHMAEPARRGRVVGTMTGGLLFGILLARPIASAIAGLGEHGAAGVDAAAAPWHAIFSGWRAVFAGAAALTALFAAILWRRLPLLRPAHAARYTALVGSMVTLFRTQPVLRKRALTQAAVFGAFSLFWTAVPWLLAARGFDQHDIALFALAGAGGALIAPFAGRLADHGHTRAVCIAGMLSASAAFAITWAGGPLWLLVIAAIVLDAGVQANHVAGQREVLSIDPASRNRLNSVYMATFFAGGAIASSLAGPLFHRGWSAVAAAGTLMPLLGLAIFLLHERREALRATVAA